jgi:hypothetical protein
MALMLRDASQRPESVEASVLARAAMLLSMRAAVPGAFRPNEATWENQPAAAGNDRRPRSVVSGLLFTMDGATPTCWAVSRRSAKGSVRAGGEGSSEQQ